METLSWFWPLSLGLFDLLFGSFANVLIWRFPRGESVVSPGSHCPSCSRPVRWFDNVPLVSWLVLRGRCRDCGEPISARYPLVEALCGVLWFAAGLRYGLSLSAGACAAFFWLLLVLAFIDLDTYRLPNALVVALAAFGVVGVVASQAFGSTVLPLVGVSPEGALRQPAISAVVGVALGAGLSGGIAWLYGRLRGRTGLGMGDVKLLGAMGLFLGPYVLMALGLGSMVGAVVGLAGAKRAAESAATHRIPFGPFLALGGAAAALTGPALWTWYMAVVGAA